MSDTSRSLAVGKAASAYVNAKIIIKLISNVAKAAASRAMQSNACLGKSQRCASLP